MTGAFFLSGLFVNALGLNVRDYDGVWHEQEGSYYVTIPVWEDREFCLCPAYVCETPMEAALLAHPTAWGWRSFQHFRDPALSVSEETTQRQAEKPVYAFGRQEFCLMKKAGDTLSVTLRESDGALLLNID
ncbi:MAG: hypothetical protein WA782_03145 [Sulfitobacter sp.]